MRYYLLEPLDTLFFRDGSPFNAGETGQMEVLGTFPPSPTTVVGALRAAFARELGWTGGEWNGKIKERLGDGADLGPLRFSGPYVTKGKEILFPAPLHLLRSGGDLAYLEPGEAVLSTDIGEARLPEVGTKIKGLKPLKNAYLTREGMEKALRGEPPAPEDIFESSELWSSESRVGIQRDPKSRTTLEDALYQTTHVRLRKGVALAAGVEGYDKEAPSLLTLGGESRMASLEQHEVSLPEVPGIEPGGGRLRYTATLITPARIEDNGWREPGGALPGLPGRVVSACVGKPVMIGGWDTEKKVPLPLEPYLPPGSTWFMEAEATELDNVKEMHTGHIGDKSEWGYGQILIGGWR
ncbi:MAG: type III-B CRISPR module-associated protein Cmr3 [Rubrobacteraceae bacterium]|nr:type III-B CRISPR module-associated protein Cmr3 [Rubrobacteraceae bacterium]